MRKLASATIIAALAGLGLGGSVALGSPRPHRHNHRHVVVVEPPLVPQGYAYGGYGNGVGPGWQLSGESPGYGYGFSPGYGYLGPGLTNLGLDLGY